MNFLILAVFFVFLFSLYRRFIYVNKVKQLPGFYTTLGIVGNMGLILSTFRRAGSTASGLTQLIASLSQLNPRSIYGEKGGLWTFWIGPMPFVVVFSPETAEDVLGSNVIIRKGQSYDVTHSWLGQGLLTSYSSKWFNNRKLLTPAFHFKILESFLPIMNRNAKVMIENLKSESENNNDIIKDIRRPILLCALDVICETAMGIKINAQKDPEAAYIKATYAMGDIIVDRICKPWTWFDVAYKWTAQGQIYFQHLNTVKKFAEVVIQERLNDLGDDSTKGTKGKVKSEKEEENMSLGVKQKEPFIDTLILEHLRNPTQLTVENIREEVDTFMFEGHDTTAWGTIWTVFLLGLHPEIQTRLQDEVDQVYDSLVDEQELTLEDLRKLCYTEAVIKESQRLYPSVPFISRQTEVDFKIGKYTVPAGTQVGVSIAQIHKDPAHWSDPEKFDPERFLNTRLKHSYSFVPFSAGPRNCIGQKFALMEEKALVASIFRNFRVTSIDTRDKITPTVSLISKASVPVSVKLIPRK